MKYTDNALNDGQMSLFAAPRERGAGEWGTFASVREHGAGMFRVKQPQQESRYSVTTIRRAMRPQSLFFKGAR